MPNLLVIRGIADLKSIFFKKLYNQTLLVNLKLFHCHCYVK